MTPSQPLCPDDLDTLVTTLSQEVEAGLRNEAEARMDIFEAVQKILAVAPTEPSESAVDARIG